MSTETGLPSFPYEVTINLLDGRRLVGDGDEIVLQEAGSANSPDSVGFQLEVAKQDMWWKGLILFEKDQTNAWTEVVAGAGHELPKYAEIPVTTLQTQYLVLSKAKGGGVHSNVYHITNAERILQPGKRYTVTWKKD